MTKGIKRQRLDQALQAAEPGRVGDGEDQWDKASVRLAKVATHLRRAAQAGLSIEGDAGKQMFKTMLMSSERLDERSQDMNRGGGALRRSGEAIVTAKMARDDIDRRLPPLTPDGFTPPDGYDDLPAWRQTEMRQTHTQNQTGLVEAREQEREDAAQQVADAFEQDYQDPIKVMQDIYGYEPPPPPPTGEAPTPVFGPAGGSGNQSGVYTGPRDTGSDDDGPRDDGPRDDGPDDSGGDDDETQLPPENPPEVLPLPIDEGPGLTPTPPTTPAVDLPGGGYGDAGSTGSGGSGPSVSPAVLGAGAGVATAGALGAAARGGIASAGSSVLRNLTSRGGPLGGSARGAGPVLGKGAGVGSAGSPTGRGAGAAGRGAGASGRGAGGLRSGAGGGAGAGRGGGRGAGAGGGRGGGKGAGGRGAGVGSGRGRGKREEEQRGDRELFDDGQDWIDDEGAAPGVID